jgi:hypothetical protein
MRGVGVIEIRKEQVGNGEHFSRLLAFCQEILAICSDQGITPVLSGSLAVFGYTQDRAIEIHDIDLACSEVQFPRLSRALDARGITHAVREWHVLQAFKADLKVEFDAMEYWLADLTEDFETLMIDGTLIQVVGLSDLRELYRRGLEATSSGIDEAVRAKHPAIAAKYEALCSVY